MAQPLCSCALSSRTTSCDAGSVPGKQKPEGLLSHLHHILLSKQVTAELRSKGWGNRPRFLMAGAREAKSHCQEAPTQGSVIHWGPLV